MLPADWNRDLAPEVPWEVAYAAVEREAKVFLDNSVLGAAPMSTNDLVERLYPQAVARGDGIAARNRIYKALDALTKHGLKRHCSRGEPRQNKMKKTIRPWLWHASKPVEVCPTCGREKE